MPHSENHHECDESGESLTVGIKAMAIATATRPIVAAWQVRIGRQASARVMEEQREDGDTAKLSPTTRAVAPSSTCRWSGTRVTNAPRTKYNAKIDA